MPLPEVIEIIALNGPVQAEVTVPGSKSITNRALVLAALADGEVTLQGALWSEDTQVMVDCLRELGFMINVEPDRAEPCNRSITVYGRSGAVPRGGTAEQPLELFVGNAGTAARFLAAMLCLGSGVYRLHGVPRMHQRPQAALFHALRALGYRIDSANDLLPAIIHGSGPRSGECTVSIEESSQFASALLLCSKRAGWTIHVTGENAEESPYVFMTVELCRQFPAGGGKFAIEPDASSGSYLWAADFLQRRAGMDHKDAPRITVAHWPRSGWQIDANFPRYLPLPAELSRETHLGDSIMTAIVLAPFHGHPTRFVDLGRLRIQECERVKALRTELAKCGAQVAEIGDTLEINPGPLHGATVDTYEDHRMAMCFATLGLKVAGMRINNPRCVRKTFPNFFQKLATRPPAGLGVRIVDVKTGRILQATELMAE